MKTIKCNVKIVNSNLIYIALPSYSKNDLVSVAKIKLGLQTIDNLSVKVSYSSYKDDKQISAWDNVNSYSNIETGKLYTLDITDEIRDAMDNSADKIILTFNNAQCITLPNNLSEQVFEYEYVSKDDYNYSNTHSFDLNLAGSGTINLATGELSLSHSDVSTNFVLPMNIVHTYNNNKNQNEYLSESYQKLTKTHTGKGFKLNVQQYLIKEQNEDGDLQFTYIDAQGKNHYFTEKYYYLSTDNEKIYVKRENLNLNPDGSYYIIVDGTIHKVDTKLETDTGLTLVSSIAGLNGSNLVDYEPEELANVRQTLKSLKENRIKYEQNLEDLKYQFTLTALNKINTKNNNKIGENINSDITSDANKLSTLISKYVDLYNKNYLSNEIFSSEHLESLKNYLLSKSKTYVQHNYNSDGTESLTQTYSCAYTDEKQIEDIVKNICEYYFNLQTINEQITKYEYQLKLLELQVPVHYLYNDEQLILGFGKTYEVVTEEEQNSSNSNDNQNNQKPDMEIQTDNTTKYNETDVYRLILVTDPYENTIFISYDELDSSKILGIADADNNNILFNYNENDLLSEIVDSKERKILFNYFSNNQLTKITHQNGEIIRYFYVDNHLTYAIDESTGLGVKFEYTNEKVTKISLLSILNNVKNGQITFNFDYNGENATSETLASLEQQEGFLIENESISFNYYDYKSTTLTDAKGNSETYVLDKYGKTKCVYENVFNENSSSNIVYAKEFNYTNDKVSENISALPYSKNYLNNACFDVLAMSIEYGYYLGDDIYLGEEAIPYSYQICKNYHTMPENETVCSVSVSSESVAEINNNITSLILSGWAKADSAFVFDVEERSGEDYTNASSEIQNRRFDISAEITYSDGSKQKFSKSFDWMNTEWQYCSLAITIDKDKTLTSILCFVDYTNNTGTIQFTDLELKEGSWSKTEYNSEKQPIKTYSSHSDVITTYTYDNNKLIKEISTHNNLEYVTTYEYDNYGKLLRKIDYNGIVSENVYNDKGICIKTKTYHKDDPTTVIYQESELDEKGNLTGELNSLGDKIGSYSYDKSGLVISYSDSAGNKTAYGYDNSDSLISMTSSINGEKNSNIFGYTGNYLTALKHNGFEINYEYDYLGRAKTALISGNEFVSKSYSECEETTNLANGATFRQEYNKKGSPLNLYYKQNADSAEVICAENIYDTNNNVVLTKEYIDGNISTSTKYTYDKFGKLSELMSNQNNAYWGIVNTYGETEDTTKITISSKDLLYTYKYDNDLDKKLNTIILPNGKQQCIKYDKLGRTNEIKLGDHIKQFHYLSSGDHTSNLISSVWYGDNTKLNENYRYRYDEKGNITEIRENGTLIARYSYDSLSRLIREDNKYFNKTITFEYDAGGNITLKSEYVFTLTSDLNEKTPTAIYPYLYKSSGWSDQLVSYNGETFEYDEIGNPTTCRGETFVWNGRQLVQLGDCKYTYNANGIRTSKIVNGIKTKFFLNGNKILAQDDGNKIYYHYGADGIAGFTLKLSDTIIYDYIYKKNIQGDIIGIYDSNNVLICKYIYDAWGNHKTLILSNNGEYIDISSTSDYTNINNNYIFIATLNPFRYRGYYFDTDTGLYYLNSRYYDPELGRFINADAIGILNTAQEELNGLNLYAYCFNNPVNDIDENGNWSWRRFWKGVLVIAVVVVAVTITVATAGAGSVAGSIIAGGIISAGGEIFNQTVIQNKTFSNINWLQVGVAGVGGMLSAIPGVGFVGGILIGGGTNALSTAIGGGSLEEIGISFLVGAFSSAVGYAASSIINRASTARLASKLTNMSKSQFKFQVRNYFRASEINTVKTLSLALSKDPNLLNKLSNKILPLIFDNIFSFITENVFS